MKKTVSVRKITALIMALLMLVCLMTACGKDSDDGSGSQSVSDKKDSGKSDSGKDKGKDKDKGGDLNLFEIGSNMEKLAENGGVEFSYTVEESDGSCSSGTHGAADGAFWMFDDGEGIGFRSDGDLYYEFDYDDENGWQLGEDVDEYYYKMFYNSWKPNVTPYIAADEMKKSGSDKIAGRSCTKYDVAYPSAGETITGTAWFDNETGFLMKADDSLGKWEVTSFKTTASCPFADITVFEFDALPENVRIDIDDNGYERYIIKLGDEVLVYSENSYYYEYYRPSDDPNDYGCWLGWVDYTYDDEGWEVDDYVYCYSIEDVLETVGASFMYDTGITNFTEDGRTENINGFDAELYTYTDEYGEELELWYSADLGYIVKCYTEYGWEYGYNMTVTGFDTSVTSFPIEIPG